MHWPHAGGRRALPPSGAFVCVGLRHSRVGGNLGAWRGDAAGVCGAEDVGVGAKRELVL